MIKQCSDDSKFAGNPDYECNTNTGRYIKKTGKTGKTAQKLKLVKSYQKSSQNIGYKQCKGVPRPDQICNPLSGRYISKSGKLYKELEKKNIFLDSSDQRINLNKNIVPIHNCNLNIQNPCTLSKCITKIDGLASNSASPSDTWIITFSKGTNFKIDNHPEIDIKQAFMKIFITPSRHLPYKNNSGKILSLYGLEYERKFYEEIIGFILNNNVSPHFIRIYNSSNNCSYDNLVDILQSARIPETHLLRNIFSMFYALVKRPSIKESTNNDNQFNIKSEHYIIKPDILRLLKSINYSIILTQYNDPDVTISFDTMLNTKIDKLTLATLLFQIAQGCFALHTLTSVHNDLHLNNILVTKRPCSGINVKYVIPDPLHLEKNLELTFKNVAICARIFDFDRSYSTILGKNRNLDEEFCDKHGLCNEIVEGKDILNVVAIVSKATEMPDWIYALLKDRNNKSWFDMIMNDRIKKNKKPLSADDIEKNINTYPTILNNFYKIYKKYGGESWGPKDSGSVYICPSPKLPR